MLIFMFLSSFLVHSRPPQARNAQLRDKGTTFFAYTQAHKHFFEKKVEKSAFSAFFSTLRHIFSSFSSD